MNRNNEFIILLVLPDIVVVVVVVVGFRLLDWRRPWDVTSDVIVALATSY
jgi:hypothetical protein